MASPSAYLNILVTADTAPANKALGKTQAQLQATAATADKATAATAGSFASMGKSMSTAGAKMQKFGRTVTTHVGLPLLAVGAYAVKSADEFDKSMTMISTQAGASAKEVKKLSKAVLAFAGSGKSAFDPKELSEALFHIESVGYRGAKAMHELRGATKLAAVGGSELEETTYALISAQKTGIRGTEHLGKAMGTLNAIVGHGDIRMEELTQSFSSGLLITAKQLGISLTEVGAAMDVMTARGVKAQNATTSLNMGLLRMATPTSTAAKVLESIGISSEKMAKVMRTEGLPAAVGVLADKLSGLSKTKANQVLTEAFGVKSAKAVRTLVGNVGELHGKVKEITGSTGDFAKKWKETQETPAFKLKAELAQLKAVMVELGNKLLPIVIPLLQQIGGAVKSVIESFNSLPKSAQSWIIKLGIAAIALGPIIAGLGTITKLAGGVVEAIAGLGGGGALASFGPWAIAIAAVAAGLYLLYKNSKQFHGAVDEMSHSVRGLAKSFDPLIAAIREGQGYFKIWGPIVKTAFIAVKGILSGLARYFAGIFQVMQGIVEVFTGVLTLKFGKAWDGVKNIFHGGIKATIGLLAAATAPLRAIAGKIGEALSSGFESGINAAINAINFLIRALNSLPFVPNIGEIGEVGGGGGTGHGGGTKQRSRGSAGTGKGSTGDQSARGRARSKARGGSIYGGAPSGDTIPAMLERGEYVLNRNAVQKIGPKQLDAINFAAAPRFSIGGDVLGAAKSVVPGLGPALGLAKSAAKGLGLSMPSLPGIFAGLPSWLLGRATDWASGKKKKLGNVSGFGNLPSGGGSVPAQMARALFAAGLNKVGAAGIIGNAYRESTWDPGAIGTGGGGLFGFTAGAISLASLQAAAKRANVPWTDVGFQIGFMLRHGGASLIPRLNAAGSAGEAAALFMNEWEHPGIPAQGEREAAAQKALAMGYQSGGLAKGSPGRTIAWARNNLGSGDRWGYEGEWCGAFMAAAMKAQGLPVPGGYPAAHSWAGYGKAVSQSEIAPGDIVDYGYNHVGMYIGNGQQINGNWGGQVALSSFPAPGVGAVTAIRRPPYKGGSRSIGAKTGASAAPKITGIGKGRAAANRVGVGHRKAVFHGEAGIGPGMTQAEVKAMKHPAEAAEEAGEGNPEAEQTLEQIRAILEQQLELEQQRNEETQRALNVSQSQYGVLAQAITAVVSGQIGGKIGLGFQAPSVAGSLASY